MKNVEGSTNVEQPKNINESALANMSDEELEKVLKAPATPTPVSDSVVEDTEVKKEDKAEEAPENPPEEPDKGLDLKAENARLSQQLDNLKKVFGRQSNELGELRAKLKAKPTAEDFDTDPVKAAEQLQERTEQEREIRKMETEQELQATAIRNMQFVNDHIPDLVQNIGAIEEVMEKLDKLPSSDIKTFKENIFLQNPWGVFQLNERAKLYARNKELEAEIAKLKKAPKEVVNKIADISRTASNVSASTGQTNNAKTKPVVSDDELAKMSDEELTEYLKQRTK